MRILIIDNYDSFTYNLVQYVQQLCPFPIDVFRNDKISLEEIECYDTIILSPGPGLPSESGITPDIISTYATRKSILGVCLGHQAIGEVFGGKLHNLETVFHGVDTEIEVVKQDEVLFSGLPHRMKVGRYHSWVVLQEQFPDVLEITAVDDQGTIMALRHKQYNVRGVQFHPESILTPLGKPILKNFIDHSVKYLEIMNEDLKNLA